MSQELFPMKERERRLRIIEAGIHDEFWQILSDSLRRYCILKQVEVVSLHAEGRKDEAHTLSLEITAMDRILNEPAVIIRTNKPLFDKFVNGVWQKLTQISEKLKSHGGNSNG